MLTGYWPHRISVVTNTLRMGVHTVRTRLESPLTYYLVVNGLGENSKDHWIQHRSADGHSDLQPPHLY